MLSKRSRDKNVLLAMVDRGSVVDGVVGGVVDNGDSVGDHLVVLLPAGLGVKGEGDLLAAGLSDDDLLLVNGVGGVDELGNIEALVLNLVLTLNFSDLNSLGDTDLLGGRVGKHAGHLKGSSDKGDLVSLSLVFLTAYLVFSLAISLVSISISSSSTSSHLHSLRLLVISNLGGGARGDNLLLLIHIGTDLSLNDGGCFLTDS